jgi:hypothetical protein
MAIHDRNRALSQKSNKKFVADWAVKEGVFLTPHNTWIARIYNNKQGFVTLSQHKTKEEAERVYEDYNKSKVK